MQQYTKTTKSVGTADAHGLVEAMDATRQGPAQLRELDGGAHVFRAGDKVRHLFVIVRGRVRLVRHLRRGAEVTVHSAGARSVLAEASLFAPAYHCDAIADEPTVVSMHDRAVLLDAWRTNADFSMALTSHLAGQVHALRERVMLLNERSAPARLLAHLGTLEQGDDDTVTIAGTWKSTASEIGLTHEATYRALRELVLGGYLERRSTRSVRILRPVLQSAE